MQVTKDEIRREILKAAKAEFIARGFANASIRTIAAGAGTSKSNLYNYYQDKDALFAAVLEPVTSHVKDVLAGQKTLSGAGGVSVYAAETQRVYMQTALDYVFENGDDFRLLLFGSAGSLLGGFKEAVVDDIADILTAWAANTAPDKAASRFLVRCVAGFYVSAIEQLLKNGVSRQGAAIYIDELLKFVQGGWRGALQ